MDGVAGERDPAAAIGVGDGESRYPCVGDGARVIEPGGAAAVWLRHPQRGRKGAEETAEDGNEQLTSVSASPPAAKPTPRSGGSGGDGADSGAAGGLVDLHGVPQVSEQDQPAAAEPHLVHVDLCVGVAAGGQGVALVSLMTCRGRPRRSAADKGTAMTLPSNGPACRASGRTGTRARRRARRARRLPRSRCRPGRRNPRRRGREEAAEHDGACSAPVADSRTRSTCGRRPGGHHSHLRQRRTGRRYSGEHRRPRHGPSHLYADHSRAARTSDSARKGGGSAVRPRRRRPRWARGAAAGTTGRHRGGRC